MPGAWNEGAERKLLLSLLEPDMKPKWDLVAERMGGSYTGEACRYVPAPSLTQAFSAWSSLLFC